MDNASIIRKLISDNTKTVLIMVFEDELQLYFEKVILSQLFGQH